MNTCCFLGHRKIDETPELMEKLSITIENLIVNENVDTFLFGSKSDFDNLCHKIVTETKEKYAHIKRVFVRSAFPDVAESYEAYLLKSYEETYFPERMRNAGRASYVERNKEMINKSDFCVFYYDENYLPPRRKNSKKGLSDYQPKSGTAVAYTYAFQKKKNIINVI